MGSTRRVAERMILERAARAHEIAEKLRTLAARLDTFQRETTSGHTLENDVHELLALADQIERL